MSQERFIYDYLSHQRSLSVDTALSLALRRAEEPYTAVMLNMIIERGNTEILSKLIQEWHEWPEARCQVLLHRVNDLYRGLRHAAINGDQQTQMNVLDIIHQSGAVRQTDLVIMLLRKMDPLVSDKAAAVLYDLAGKANSAASGDGADKPSRAAAGSPQVLRSALQEGLDSFRLHRRQEVVLAAMRYAAAEDRGFWGHHLDHYQSVYGAAANLLETVQDDDIVPFCLSALNHPVLCFAAMRALIYHTRPSYILRAAHEICQCGDEKIIVQLAGIQSPRWLSAAWLSGVALTDENRCELAALANLVSAPAALLMRFLKTLLIGGNERVYNKIFWQVSREPVTLTAEVLADILNGPSETAAGGALERLWRGLPKCRSHYLALALKSPHASIRQRAQTRLLEAAFNVFWRQYDRLDHRQRQRTAQMLLHLGALPVHRWRERVRHPDARLRIQALRRAEIFSDDPLVVDEIVRLTGDRNTAVRSCAVAVLGGFARQSPIAEKAVLQALRDPNARVRANAVEALERGGLQKYQSVLEPLLHHAHQRIRANAVKALLSWRVNSAQQSLAAMLADSRPAHRRSGRWVAWHFARRQKPFLTELRNESHDNRLISV